MRCFTSSTVAFAIGVTASAPSRSTAIEIRGVRCNLAISLLNRLQFRDHHLRHLLLQIAIAHAREMRAHLVVRPFGRTPEKCSTDSPRPGPCVSKSTAGFESVVARMIVLRIRSGGSSSATAWPEPAADLLIFVVGSSSPMMRAPTAGSFVAGIDKRFAVERIEALRNVARQFQMLRSDPRPPARSPPDKAEYRPPSAPDIGTDRRRSIPARRLWL